MAAFFDGCHLIKGSRNNLLNKLLETNVISNPALNAARSDKTFVSWTVIQKAHEIDMYSNTIRPQLPKLTLAHTDPALIKRMRVKHAVQVLSATVARYIDVLANMSGEFSFLLPSYVIAGEKEFLKGSRTY